MGKAYIVTDYVGLAFFITKKHHTLNLLTCGVIRVGRGAALIEPLN